MRVNFSFIFRLLKTSNFKMSLIWRKPICKDYCYNDAECSDGLGLFNTETDSFNTTEINKSCKCTSERFSGERCEFDKCFDKINTCPANCTLDAQCKCLCGQECDAYYCNNKKGMCYENTKGHLSCKLSHFLKVNFF